MSVYRLYAYLTWLLARGSNNLLTEVSAIQCCAFPDILSATAKACRQIAQRWKWPRPRLALFMQHNMSYLIQAQPGRKKQHCAVSLQSFWCNPFLTKTSTCSKPGYFSRLQCSFISFPRHVKPLSQLA